MAAMPAMAVQLDMDMDQLVGPAADGETADGATAVGVMAGVTVDGETAATVMAGVLAMVDMVPLDMVIMVNTSVTHTVRMTVELIHLISRRENFFLILFFDHFILIDFLFLSYRSPTYQFAHHRS